MNLDKMMPSAVDVEAVIIGTLLIDFQVAEDILPLLSPECFYDETMQLIFGAIRSLSKKEVKIDLVTVITELKSMSILEAVGGAGKLSSLMMPIASHMNLDFHIKILLQKSIQRKLITFARKLEMEAFKPTADSLELHSNAITTLDKLADFTFDSSDVITAKEAVREQRQTADLRAKAYKDGKIEGAITGLNKVDNFLGGFKPGNLIILAAATSMGKTAFMLEIAYYSAIGGIPVLIFSKEMTNTELIERLIVKHSHGRIDNMKISRGNLSINEIRWMTDAQLFIESLPIQLSDANQTISSIRRKSKRWALKNINGVILDDYIQLSESEDDQKEHNREREIGKISRGCKKIAVELKVPYIALSQLSRALERRDDKRPILPDLRDSGSLEQDANVVLFLYREEYYIKMKNQIPEDEHIGQMEVIIRKHRGGALGTVRCFYNESMSNFYDHKGDMPMFVNELPVLQLQPSRHWQDGGDPEI